ncbi:hypothetical protein H3V11_10805 [Snodgrassella sp. W8158]|uniref:hypothetical protein n=1 Tax=Snodgrassella sp. W8158 TaxID=2751018 RepID=UPI0018DC8E73|nr:hypothetical protein [Snodgrassella sp. W8158]MBI0182422.1 hypothetical protein [Snodgrassella sp. W8158]
MDTELEYICLRSSYPVGQAYYRLDLTNKLGYDEIIWLNSPENLRDASLNVVFSEIREVQQTQMLIINYLYSNKEKFNFITEEPQDGEYVWVSDLFYEGFASFFEYDSSWDTTKQAFKNHILFTTADGAVKATKSIIQILRREAAEKRFKPLTKEPQDGTTVYMADVTSKDGYKSLSYTKEFEHLLNYRLLYPDIYEAIQASTAMRQLINPPIPVTTKKPEPDKQ